MSTSAPDKATQRVTVSEDELEILELFRLMKGADAGRLDHDDAAASLGVAAEGAAPFDQAVVIAHDPKADRLQLGYVDLTRADLQKIELIPVPSGKDYDMIEELWGNLTSESDATVSGESKRPSLLQYASEQFERARLVHRRARDTIARYDETSRRSDELSKRTKELLSQNNS